jgi:hypothetical protein
MASRYFSEIAQKCKNVSERATELSNQYDRVAKLLNKARDQRLPSDEKIKMLQEAQKTEEFCMSEIEKLLAAF